MNEPTRPHHVSPQAEPAARTPEEWRKLYAQDLPGVGVHQRAGEACVFCGGYWPCMFVERR